MTFYQELQLNQAGSKNLLKKSETLKEKLYHMWVYLVKIAATMAFCFFFVSIFSILFGNENSIVGVVVLLCLMVFRNADLGIHTGQSTMLLALFFVIMTVCASRKAGGTGIMYTVMVDGKECHLYYEFDKWFMERKSA